MLHSRLLRALLFGGSGVVLQTSIFEILRWYLHLVQASTAALIGGEAGILLSFALNNHLTFTDHAHKQTPVAHRLVKYHLVAGSSVCLQWVLLFSTEQFTQVPLYLHIAYVAGIGIGFISNYTLYHVWVWKHPTQKN